MCINKNVMYISSLSVVLATLWSWTNVASAFQPRSPSYRNARTKITAVSSTETATSTNSKIPIRENWDRQAWINGWHNVESESCYELDGTLPADLHGTFYQNGPAKFYYPNGDIVIHPFDGDGMITAITFKNGRAWFRNRFVQTPEYVAERQAGRVLFRGIFGTMKRKGAWWANIFDLGFKKLANTGVMFAGNRLFALWEGARPFEVDPVTLETIEYSTLDNTLDESDNYAAHYRVDPKTGNICNFGIKPSPLNMNKEHICSITEHDRNLKLVYKKKVTLPGFGLSHDCLITDDYFIFLQAPVLFDPIPLLLGQKGLGECIQQDSSRSTGRLLLVPRGRNEKEPIIIDVPPYFSFHLVNAYHDGDLLHFDATMAQHVKMADDGRTQYPERPIWETVEFAKENPGWKLMRFTVNVVKKEFVSSQVMTDNASANVDFPMIHPSRVGREYRYAWCGTSASKDTVGPIQGLAKVDVSIGAIVQKWLPEPHEFVSEMLFVPRSETEDDGYLLGYLIDGRAATTHVIVLDAADIAKGPQYKIPLQTYLCHPLHGTFVQGFVPSLDEKVLQSYRQ